MTWMYFIVGYLIIPVVMLAYVPFVAWISYWVAKRIGPWPVKLSVGVPLFLLLAVLPLADEVRGRMQFRSFCSTEARLTVYRTATLEARDLRPDGYLKSDLIGPGAGFRVGERYRHEFATADVAEWPRIVRTRDTYRDDATGQVLGEKIDFTYWHGWLVRWLPGHLRGYKCDEGKPGPHLVHLVFTNYPGAPR